LKFFRGQKRKFQGLRFGFAHPLWTFQKNISHKIVFLLFWLFLSEVLSRQSRLWRTTSDPAKKGGKI
tara:strand:- start:320 stop:520 length:201 start_codon:yes stop_codon:yes gene_type:complete